MQSFTWQDICAEVEVIEGPHQLDGKALGATVDVPLALQSQFPYNVSAYQWMQQLREQILQYGTIEFPNLPVNKSNYTLAQRAPQQHGYSNNHYLTDLYQQPHQDTPPYPTAFWLPQERQYSATWVVSTAMKNQFYELAAQYDTASLHKYLVQQSLEQKTGLLLNHKPGLLLIDNSNSCSLFHARTSQVVRLAEALDAGHTITDTPMYAFNEPGLLHYLHQLDSRRGTEHLNEQEQQAVAVFLQQERLAQRYTAAY